VLEAEKLPKQKNIGTAQIVENYYNLNMSGKKEILNYYIIIIYYINNKITIS